MKVKELQAILNEWHPDEEVCLFSSSHRHMQITGLNDILSRDEKCLVLDCDWAIGDKPIESEKDKLTRQRDNLNEAIAKLNKEEKRAIEANVKKARHRAKKTRTAAQQIMDGYVPTGKRGRPRKMIVPTDQETDQSSEK